MAEVTTVPLTIEPEAAAHVDALGMRSELEQMIEHTRQSVSDLQRIDVVLAEPYDTGDEPGIIIWARKKTRRLGNDRTGWEWGHWKVTTFSPDVCRHFVMLISYGTPNAR